MSYLKRLPRDHPIYTGGSIIGGCGKAIPVADRPEDEELNDDEEVGKAGNDEASASGTLSAPDD